MAPHDLRLLTDYVEVPPSTAWRTAFIALTCLDQEWQRTRAELPPDAGPGTAAYDDALDAYQSECWSYLADWRGYGHVLRQLDEATARVAPAPTMPTARPHREPTNGPTRT
jgi:hypothetical protein